MVPIIDSEFIFGIEELKSAIGKVTDLRLDEERRNVIYDEILDNIRSGDLVRWFAGGEMREQAISRQLTISSSKGSNTDNDLWKQILGLVGLSANSVINYGESVTLVSSEYLDADGHYKTVNNNKIKIRGFKVVCLKFSFSCRKPSNNRIPIKLVVINKKSGNHIKEEIKQMPLNTADKQDVVISYSFPFEESSQYVTVLYVDNVLRTEYSISEGMNDEELSNFQYKHAIASLHSDKIKIKTTIPYSSELTSIRCFFTNKSDFRGIEDFYYVIYVDNVETERFVVSEDIDSINPSFIVTLPDIVHRLLSDKLMRLSTVTMSMYIKETKINTFTFDKKSLTFTVKTGLSFTMIKVKGGRFDMSDDYKVTLSDYYIGEVPVTQRLWKAVMAGITAGDIYFGFEGDDRPAESVSWDMIRKPSGFLDRLNEMLKDKLPKGMKFQLPTEAQWEFAARGGTKSRGYNYSGSDTIDEVAWFNRNSGFETHSVKDSRKKANELGIHDMSGNVWEWCEDWYGVYQSEESKDPKGPLSGTYRVVRGGSWDNGAWYCAVSSRNGGSPDCTDNYTGFRLALSEL